MPKHFPECAPDCGADEHGIQIAQASPNEGYPDDPKWYGFFSHDTLSETYEGDPCYGAAFEVLAEGDSRAEVEAILFWQEIKRELELVGCEIDDLGPQALRSGNIPCGLYFFPDGNVASESAYREMLADVWPRRLVIAISSVVAPGPLFRKYDDAHARGYV